MANPYWDILNGVKTRLNTVSGVPTVILQRSVMLFDPSESNSPCVIVARSADNFIEVDGASEGTVFNEYYVDVSLITPTQRTLSDGLEAYCQLEYDINVELNKVLLSGVSAVWNSRQVSASMMRPVGTNYEARDWKMAYTTNETRAS